MNSCCQPQSLNPPRLISQGFTYFFNSGTFNLDPGDGSFRYNQITQASTTVIYINYVTAAGVNIQNYIQNIANSTNPILGQIYILQSDDSGNGQVFNVTAVTQYTTYAALTVSLVQEMNGPNPLVFGVGVVFSFVQAGNAGVPGTAIVPNNTTNPTFVGSGQIPEFAGATAAVGQTATCTFGTNAMLFAVTLGNGGQYMLCGTSYGSSTISAIDDPAALFTSDPSGPGLYIFKSANSNVVSFKNLTGASDVILVQAINSPITAATVWS